MHADRTASAWPSFSLGVSGRRCRRRGHSVPSRRRVPMRAGRTQRWPPRSSLRNSRMIVSSVTASTRYPDTTRLWKGLVLGAGGPNALHARLHRRDRAGLRQCSPSPCRLLSCRLGLARQAERHRPPAPALATPFRRNSLTSSGGLRRRRSADSSEESPPLALRDRGSFAARRHLIDATMLGIQAAILDAPHSLEPLDHAHAGEV